MNPGPRGVCPAVAVNRETNMKLALKILVGVAAVLPQALAAQDTVGIAGQEQACAGEYGMMLDVPMSDIRVNGHDTSPAGNTVVFLQTADDAHSANCEVDDYGNVVAIERTRN